MAPLLQVSGLDAFYGRAQVLFGLEFEVAEGEVTVLLGRNGAGKSTTLLALLGLVAATGEIRVAGRSVVGEPPHRRARHGLGWVPEERRIFAGLTVEENLEVGRRGAEPWNAARVFALFPALEPLRRRRAGTLSGGEQQMLAIGRALMANPRIVLLDEPSEGLAPVVVEQLAEAVRSLKGAGAGILLSEQNLRFAAAVADHAFLLESGRVRWRGTMAALQEDDAARRRWLAV